MKVSNLIAVSLIVILVGVGGFAILGRSDLKTPEVIIVGAPSEIPTSIRSALPTGYRWQVEKDIPFDITGEQSDPRALFALDEHTNKTAINEIMEWASKNGKQEVYFFYIPPVDPDEWVRYEKHLMLPIYFRNLIGQICVSSFYHISPHQMHGLLGT
ncbi:MAG: hypothetical protein IT344_09500 [Candidatus Dadabacteria bacterium]|nr:hypothetical protein [Candidatus Dadabacteria bacterium]